MLLPDETLFPTLVTERLVLRQLRENDAHDIMLLRSDEWVNRYIDRAPTFSLDDARAFIVKMTSNQSLYWAVALKTDDKLIGTMCMWNFSEDRLTAEVGYELHPDFQKQGLMREGLQELIEYGFNRFGLRVIEAYVNPDNESSINLLKKNHFFVAPDLFTTMENGHLQTLAIYSLVKA